MKIAVGSDHAGYAYKEAIKQNLMRQGHTIKDFGAFSDELSNYPVFVRPVAEAVAQGLYERGIVVGGSGNGEAIVANRVPGIRCAVCWNEESARLAKSHNDANIISLGQRMMTEGTALAIVNMWLKTAFDGGRHAERIKMIDGKAE